MGELHADSDIETVYRWRASINLTALREGLRLLRDALGSALPVDLGDGESASGGAAACAETRDGPADGAQPEFLCSVCARDASCGDVVKVCNSCVSSQWMHPPCLQDLLGAATTAPMLATCPTCRGPLIGVDWFYDMPGRPCNKRPVLPNLVYMIEAAGASCILRLKTDTYVVVPRL